MALTCKVQYLDDTDPFASTNFPEPTRPPTYTFHLNIPLGQQIAGLHRLLKAPHSFEDVALQLSHNGTYLDLESTLEEQADDLDGFLESRKNTIILRTQLSVRVHNCIAKLLGASGRELRRALFSLKQIFQDDKDLVHEFVNSDGLNALITVGTDADQNYQNYILRALGQVMLYVDGMNGVIKNNETIQWLYSLTASRYRLVAKTALKLLLVFVEYTEANSKLLHDAVKIVDKAQGSREWFQIMGILEEKGGMGDDELLVYSMTLINKVLAATPDQDTFYDVTDALEEQGLENIVAMHSKKSDRNEDLLEQFSIYDTALKIEDGEEELPAFSDQPSIRHRKRAVSRSPDARGGDRRRSKRHNSISSQVNLGGRFLKPSQHPTRSMSLSAPSINREVSVEEEVEHEKPHERQSRPERLGRADRQDRTERTAERTERLSREEKKPERSFREEKKPDRFSRDDKRPERPSREEKVEKPSSPEVIKPTEPSEPVATEEPEADKTQESIILTAKEERARNRQLRRQRRAARLNASSEGNLSTSEEKLCVENSEETEEKLTPLALARRKFGGAQEPSAIFNGIMSGQDTEENKKESPLPSPTPSPAPSEEEGSQSSSRMS